MKRIIVLVLVMVAVTLNAIGSEELCCVSDYEILQPKNPEIILGNIIYAPSKFRCPGCDFINDEMPQHGEHWECKKCKLVLVVWGNSIELIKE